MSRFRCDNCGTPDDGTDLCPGCRHEFVVILCPYCMQQVRDDTVACPHCGEDTTRDAKFEASPPQARSFEVQRCGRCEAELPRLAVRCHRCREWLSPRA